MDISTLLAFAAAFFVFAASPGPDNMTIVARTISHGAASGIAYGAGTVAGILIFLTLAAFGLSIIAAEMGIVMTILRYATGIVPLDAYQVEHGKVGTPSTVVEDLTAALTQGIEELTRPVDAIKHQAKTVTVGISRSDEGLLQVPLVAAVLDAGAGRDRLSYKALRALAALDPAVAEVRGFTRYAIDETGKGPQPNLH